MKEHLIYTNLGNYLKQRKETEMFSIAASKEEEIRTVIHFYAKSKAYAKTKQRSLPLPAELLSSACTWVV